MNPWKIHNTPQNKKYIIHHKYKIIIFVAGRFGKYKVTKMIVKLSVSTWNNSKKCSRWCSYPNCWSSHFTVNQKVIQLSCGSLASGPARVTPFFMDPRNAESVMGGIKHCIYSTHLSLVETSHSLAMSQFWVSTLVSSLTKVRLVFLYSCLILESRTHEPRHLTNKTEVSSLEHVAGKPCLFCS